MHTVRHRSCQHQCITEDQRDDMCQIKSKNDYREQDRGSNPAQETTVRAGSCHV